MRRAQRILSSLIATVTLNPSVDQHLTVRKLAKDDALRAVRVEWFAGGKGVNVARVVRELGGRGCAFGFLGGFPGRMLAGWLDRTRVPHRFTSIRGDTRINTTLTDLSDSTQTHVRAPGPRVSAGDLDRLVAQLLRVRPVPRFWVLGGSLPPGAPNSFYRRLINRLEATGASCVLDTDDEALAIGLDATPFLIKPNEHEFERLTGCKADSDRCIVAASRELVRQGTAVVMTTLGPRGAVVVSKQEAFKLHTPKVRVKSKVGAGDSTVAGTLVALVRGASLREAARFGVAAGTAAVLTEGTQLCERRQAERLLSKIRIEPLRFPGR